MFHDPNPPDPILDHNDPRIAVDKQHVGILRKAKNAAKASGKIIQAARNKDNLFVKKEEWKKRSSICNACYLWNPKGNLGMGECSHGKCGCTKLKRGLATESCPLNKW